MMWNFLECGDNIMKKYSLIIGFLSIFCNTEVMCMNATTAAYDHMNACVKSVKKMRMVSPDAIHEFRQAIQNPNDDPGCYGLLSEIAKRVGLEREIYMMWDEYGLTERGRKLLLQIEDISLQEAILASLIKEKK